MQKKNFTTVLLLILITVISFIIKITYINNTETITPKGDSKYIIIEADAGQYAIYGDAGQYVYYGYNLYKYGIYSEHQPKSPVPDSYRSPGFPMLIALAFHVGGVSNFYFLVLLIQVIITSLLVPLSFMLARMFLPTFGAFLVAFLVAFSPHLITVSSYLLSESLLSFLILTALTSFLYGIRNSNKILLIFSNIFFGLSYLTNEVTFFIPFVVSVITGLYFLRSHQPENKMKFVKIILLGLIIFSLFPLGWSLRNSLHASNGFMKSSNRALSTLTHGTYPDFIYKSPQYKYFPYREDPEQPEYSSSINKFFEIFTKRVKERPLRYLSWYIIEKPYYLWTWEIMQGQGDIYIYPIKSSLFTKYPLANDLKNFLKYLHILLHFSIYAGFITLFFSKDHNGNDHKIHVLFSIFLYLSLIYAVFVPWPRYAIPYRPVFYTLGVWSIYSMYDLIKTKNVFLKQQIG